MVDSELFVASFARGLSVVQTFREGRERQTLAEIAKNAGLSRASARRLVHTLVELGYARAEGRTYCLTAKMLDLGYSYLSSTSLWNMVQPYMEDVVAATGASCSISVLDGGDIIYVARVSPRQLMRRVVSIGSRIPAHAIAMGRVQLAALGEPALRRRLDEMNIQQFTSHTVTDRNALFDLIMADGARGWSLVDRELDEGISGIAMAIQGKNNAVIAGINLSLKPEQVAQAETLAFLHKSLTNTVAIINRIAQTQSGEPA